MFFFKKFCRNQTSLFHGMFYKYFSNFSKTTQSSLRKVAQDSFCTKKQKSKNFAFFSINFYDFYQKKHNSQKLLNIFLVVSRLFKRVLKTFSEKNLKKIKRFKLVKKFRTPFFFSDFFIFLSKKVYFSKTIPYFFLLFSRPFRRVSKTFSEKNSKKKMSRHFELFFSAIFSLLYKKK